MSSVFPKKEIEKKKGRRKKETPIEKSKRIERDGYAIVRDLIEGLDGWTISDLCTSKGNCDFTIAPAASPLLERRVEMKASEAANPNFVGADVKSAGKRDRALLWDCRAFADVMIFVHFPVPTDYGIYIVPIREEFKQLLSVEKIERIDTLSSKVKRCSTAADFIAEWKNVLRSQ